MLLRFMKVLPMGILLTSNLVPSIFKGFSYIIARMTRGSIIFVGLLKIVVPDIQYQLSPGLSSFEISLSVVSI